MKTLARAPRRSRRSDETSAALRLAIERGQFQTAHSLPGERQLAQLLRVSRTTLRRALADLIGKGLLVQRQGMGTFITRPEAMDASVRRRAPAPAFEANLYGPCTAVRELGRGTALPAPEDAMMLGVAPSERVMRLSRLVLDGDVAVAVEHTIIPMVFLSDPAFEAADLVSALAASGFAPIRTLHRLRMVRPSLIDTGHLGLPSETNAMLIERAAYLADGRCCLVSRSLCRADRLDAVFETRFSVPSNPMER